MGESGEVVLSGSFVSENEPIAQEGKCRLANGPLTELFFPNRKEMVLERTLYSELSESWKTL